MSEKSFITNRKHQKISVLLERSENQKELAFVMHGLGGFKEQTHLQAMVEAFQETDFTVVRFDTTNTLGESDGDYADATTTNYYEDLEDVVAWAKTQVWYQEPFFLAGHSTGGMCTALFAEHYPKRVRGLAPISTVVSGELTIEAEQQRNPKEFQEWERTGWKIQPSNSKPGRIKNLRWKHYVTDVLTHNLLTKVHNLTMPVLLIVGEDDKGTPLSHHKLLFDNLPGKRELHIIQGAPHTFREQKHLEEIKQIFREWIRANA